MLRKKIRTEAEAFEKAVSQARGELKKILNLSALSRKKEEKLQQFLSWWERHPQEIKRSIFVPNKASVPNDQTDYAFAKELASLHEYFPYPYDGNLPEILETILEWQYEKKKKNETATDRAYSALESILSEDSNLNHEGKLRALLHWWSVWDSSTKFTTIFMPSGNVPLYQEVFSILNTAPVESEPMVRGALEEYFALYRKWDGRTMGFHWR